MGQLLSRFRRGEEAENALPLHLLAQSRYSQGQPHPQAGTSQGQPSQVGTSQGQLHPQAGTGQGQPSQAGTSQGQPSQAGTSQGQPSQAGTSQGQQSQAGTSQGQLHPQAGTSQGQPQTPVEIATDFWRQSVRDWYHNLHSQTYFIPPLHFNRVHYDVQSFEGQPVLIPVPGNVPVNPVPSGPPPQSNPPPLASRLWPDNPLPPGQLPRVQDSDVNDDHATQDVLQYIRELAEREQEVMMVLHQLQFRKYLDNQVDPITAAATRLPIPRPDSLGPSYQHGDFDVLMISRYGLIVGEVKSVGADPHYSTDQAVVKRVHKAVKQLNKADVVLRHLVSDLAPVNVTKTLMLPNVTCTQLQQALSTNPQVEQDVLQCFGVTDLDAAISKCLCQDDIKSEPRSPWWQQLGVDAAQTMTEELYEILAARFCGPATTIEVPTITTPRRCMEMRILSEAVAHTGLRIAILTLHPEQMDLLNRTDLHVVFLWGPPGTGKTVVLTLKGIQWGRRGKDVHLFSSHQHSRAAIFLIQAQLEHVLGASHVHIHMFDFSKRGDVQAAVNELTLAAAAAGDELCVIADEAYDGSVFKRGQFARFCTLLAARVPHLHLWAAAVQRDSTVPGLTEVKLTLPVRCPPAVVRHVLKSKYIDDKSVPRYTSSATPAPTDGPEVRCLPHNFQSGHRISNYCWFLLIAPLRCFVPVPPLFRFLWDPARCEACGDNIADLIEEQLTVSGPHQLEYRDFLILCRSPRDSLGIVGRLRHRNIPVRVITSGDSDDAIRDMSIAVRNEVVVTGGDVVRGLERRVVVGMERANYLLNAFLTYGNRLHEASRSTSLFVWIGRPGGAEDERSSHVVRVLSVVAILLLLIFISSMIIWQTAG